MNRDNIIKFIPKPENKDIILYDTSLVDLIDVNVLEEYNKLYPIFFAKREQYLQLKEKLDEYQHIINTIYLFKPYWTEADYLQSLQNDRKTYSTLFGEIKKTENNIAILQKNLKGINEKIEIQKAKDAKQINDKKESINEDIEKSKEKLSVYKNSLDTYKISLSKIEQQIQENEEEFSILEKMQEQLSTGKCKCEYCGRTIKSTSEDSIIYGRIIKKLEKNKDNLEKILAQKEKVELEIAFYESEIRKIKDNLNNDIQFRKENNVLYQKKSLDVLKLEALRDEMLNNIASLQKQLDANSKTKSEQYLALKSNIEKYELSLENLNKIKEIKKDKEQEIEKFNSLKEELKEILKKINQYISFVNIYFKILEQKASEYCGPDFKFKLFKIEDYKLIPMLEIYYKDIEYSELDQKAKKWIDEVLIEKFSIYF